MKKLCRKLNIHTYVGVGILESLWHLTAREAPLGDIGKLSDEDIAIGIDYEGDPEKLVNALIDSGWLDKSPVFRLVVHDWHEHADDATKKAVERKRLTFASLSGNVVTSPDISRLPEPAPAPEPIPVPVPDPSQTEGRSSADDSVDTTETEMVSPDEDEDPVETVRKMIRDYVKKGCGLDWPEPSIGDAERVMVALNGHDLNELRTYLHSLLRKSKRPDVGYGWFATLVGAHYGGFNARKAIPRRTGSKTTSPVM